MVIDSLSQERSGALDEAAVGSYPGARAIAPVLAACGEHVAAAGCAVVLDDGVRAAVAGTWRRRPGAGSAADAAFLLLSRWSVHADRPLVLGDVLEQPGTHQQLQEVGGHVAAYLLLPLRHVDGRRAGTFCVVDDRPRTWARRDLAAVRRYAALVEVAVSQALLPRSAPPEERPSAATTAPTRTAVTAVVDRSAGSSRTDGPVEHRRTMTRATRELRNSVSSVVGFSELLEDALGEGTALVEQAVMLDHVRRGAARVARLAEDLDLYLSLEGSDGADAATTAELVDLTALTVAGAGLRGRTVEGADEVLLVRGAAGAVRRVVAAVLDLADAAGDAVLHCGGEGDEAVVRLVAPLTDGAAVLGQDDDGLGLEFATTIATRLHGSLTLARSTSVGAGSAVGGTTTLELRLPLATS